MTNCDLRELASVEEMRTSEGTLHGAHAALLQGVLACVSGLFSRALAGPDPCPPQPAAAPTAGTWRSAVPTHKSWIILKLIKVGAQRP